MLNVSPYRYGLLAFEGAGRRPGGAEGCRRLLGRLRLDGWAVGRSKVFLKYYHVELLTKLHDKQVIIGTHPV